MDEGDAQTHELEHSASFIDKLISSLKGDALKPGFPVVVLTLSVKEQKIKPTDPHGSTEAIATYSFGIKALDRYPQLNRGSVYNLDPKRIYRRIYFLISIFKPTLVLEKTTLKIARSLTCDSEFRIDACELDRILEQITKYGRSIISGMGGMGKSVLARQFLGFMMGSLAVHNSKDLTDLRKQTLLESNHYTEVYWINCATELSALNGLQEILPNAKTDEIKKHASDFLATTRQYLLILDNVDDIGVVDSVFEHSRSLGFGGDVIITTRLETIEDGMFLKAFKHNVSGFHTEPIVLRPWSTDIAYDFILDTTENANIQDTEYGNRLLSIVQSIQGYPLVVRTFQILLKNGEVSLSEVETALRTAMSGTGDQGDSRSLHVIVSLSMSKLMKRGTQGIEACKLFAATSLLGPDNIPYGLIKAIAAEMKLTGPATALATLLGQSGLIRLGADDNYHTHSLIQQVAQQFSESTHELAFSEVINATGSAMLSFEKTLGLKAHSLSEHFEHYAAKAIPETYSAQMHAEIEKALAMQLSDKALYGAAISVFERNLRRSEILFETRLNPLVGTILKEMGDTMHAMGRLDQAMECLNESLHITILCFGTRNNPQTPPILNSIGGLKRSTGDLSDALECFQEAEDIMANSSTGKCERILGQIVGNIGLVSKSKGLFIQAFDEYEQATQLEQIDSGNSQSLSRAVNLNNMSPIARYQGRYDEAIKLCQDSLEIKKKIFDTEDHPGIAKTYQNLGLIMRDKGDLHESLRYFTKSIDIFKAVYKTNEHIDIAGVLTNIGVIESELEHHDSAFRHHQEALDILKNIQGYQTHPLYLIIMQNIALEMDSQGQLKDALNRLKELKELHLNLKENMSQNDYARVLYNIGKVAYSMGSIYEAKDYIAEGIKVTSKIHGTRVNPDLALANCTMAKILSDLGDSCRGLQLCQECLSIFEHIYGTRKHAVIARILSIMGGIASAAWQFDDAVQHYRDSIAIFEHISEAQYSSSIVSLLVGLGFVLSEQKNYDQAHSCFLKALKICREIGEPQGYLPTATVLNGIGVTLINRGRLDEAQSKLQEALNVCKNVKGDRRFPVMTAAIQNLGTVARKQDKPQEALKYFRDAQMIMKSNGFGNAITHSANLEMIAKIEHKCGDHESALRDYQEAVDILVKFFNTKSHEKVVQAMCNVLSIRVYFKNYRESDALAQEIISIMEKLLGSRHHALIAHALIHQGISAKANNSHECAWKYLQEGHDILVKLNDEEYMCHLSVALRAMGELSYSKRNLKMAFKLFEEAMTTSVKANGTRNHIDSVNILNLMATVADDEGYHEKSTNLYSEALRILKTLDGNHEKEIARVLSNLGYCTLKGGDFDLSFRYYEQSLDYWERAYGTRNTPDAAECLRSMAMAKALSRDEEGAQRFTHQFKEIMHAIQNDGQTVSGEYVALRFRRAGM